MTSSATDAALALRGAFFAELLKARTFPAIPRTIIFGAAALLAVTTFAASQARGFLAAGRGEALGGLTTPDIAMVLLHYGQAIPIMLGAWVMGQDNPIGPRQSALLATARRGRLLVVKLVTTTIIALAAGVICVIATLGPLAATDSGAISLKPDGWLIGYWVLIAVVTASLTAATDSIGFAVTAILAWTIGLSDLLATRTPALAGALDQAFKSAYLQDGLVPSATVLFAAMTQVVAAVTVGATFYVRRDVR